jgi:glycerol-3-phosphate acyltransferase PlsY
MKVERSLRLIAMAVLALVALLAPVLAFSQSCALCYTQAASSSARMIRALQSGILILVIPPTLASVGMIFVVYRKRNQVRRTDYGTESRDW